ncbi:hypothetical protein VCEM1626_002407B, partial [Vibrio cholerae O1 str. EM-1626]
LQIRGTLRFFDYSFNRWPIQRIRLHNIQSIIQQLNPLDRT